MEQVNRTEELSHHGVPGQKWGFRRYQNKDGTLTPAGKRRAEKLKQKYTELTGKRLIRKPTSKDVKKEDQTAEKDTKKKRIKDMTDTEINDRITRLRKEKELASLQAETASNGTKIVKSVGKDVIAPAAVEAGKRIFTTWFEKQGKKALGLDNNKVDAFAELKKEVTGLELRKRKIEAENKIALGEAQKARRENEEREKKKSK